MIYLLAFGMAFAITAVLTPWVRRLAIRHGIMDLPDGSRKIHSWPIAYLGGVAIFAGFLVSVAVWLQPTRQLVALVLGCFILVAVGVIDDKRGLSPWVKLAAQFAAAGIALSGGIGITSITNPLGGVIDLSWGRFDMSLWGFDFHIMPLANAVSLLWMVGLANTINFLDGLDGLACGVSGIAAFIIFLMAVGPRVYQPEVALLAIIIAGAAFGFLPFNFYPARIFMGDSGAYFLGLALAMLAVYSGAKLATAALVLGFPILDAVWAATRRLIAGTSPFRADRKHFHHLMLDVGMSQRKAVLTIYALSLAFGTTALIVGPFEKLVAMVVLAVTMALAITVLLVMRYAQSRTTEIK